MGERNPFTCAGCSNSTGGRAKTPKAGMKFGWDSLWGPRFISLFESLRVFVEGEAFFCVSSLIFQVLGLGAQQ